MANPRKSNDDDLDLIKGWRRGELAAFEALVRRHQKRLLNIAFRITGDYEQACTIVQHTFTAAYQSGEPLRGGVRLSTWLAAVTIRLCRERLRQRQEQRNPAEVPESGYQTIRGPAATAQPAGDPLWRDPHDHLQDCLGTLQLEQREVLVLHDVEEFSYEEICAILKVRPDAVAARLEAARQMLKSCLTGEVH